MCAVHDKLHLPWRIQGNDPKVCISTTSLPKRCVRHSGVARFLWRPGGVITTAAMEEKRNYELFGGKTQWFIGFAFTWLGNWKLVQASVCLYIYIYIFFFKPSYLYSAHFCGFLDSFDGGGSITPPPYSHALGKDRMADKKRPLYALESVDSLNMYNVIDKYFCPPVFINSCVCYGMHKYLCVLRMWTACS